MGEVTQKEIIDLIEHAVDCWHEVAKGHDIKPCNCFRETFVRRLMSEGLFNGYDKIESSHP